jgi:hypothetical protein
MDPESVLRSRALGVVAVGIVALLFVAGVSQIAARVLEVESVVLAPLAVALAFAAIVGYAGRGAAGGRRTPYW